MNTALVVPPTLEQVRSEMEIPSRDLAERGQRDAVGFASKAEQMDLAWDLSTSPPPPMALGPAPPPGVLGVICPHDDYLYAARVYRQVIPLVTARTVIVIGVFHRYRRFVEQTSFFPGAALVSGRQHWSLADKPWAAIGIGLAIAITVVMLHPYLFGGSPLG